MPNWVVYAVAGVLGAVLLFAGTLFFTAMILEIRRSLNPRLLPASHAPAMAVAAMRLGRDGAEFQIQRRGDEYEVLRLQKYATDDGYGIRVFVITPDLESVEGLQFAPNRWLLRRQVPSLGDAPPGTDIVSADCGSDEAMLQRVVVLVITQVWQLLVDDSVYVRRCGVFGASWQDIEALARSELTPSV